MVFIFVTESITIRLCIFLELFGTQGNGKWDCIMLWLRRYVWWRAVDVVIAKEFSSG